MEHALLRIPRNTVDLISRPNDRAGATSNSTTYKHDTNALGRFPQSAYSTTDDKNEGRAALEATLQDLKYEGPTPSETKKWGVLFIPCEGPLPTSITHR